MGGARARGAAQLALAGGILSALLLFLLARHPAQRPAPPRAASAPAAEAEDENSMSLSEFKRTAEAQDGLSDAETALLDCGHWPEEAEIRAGLDRLDVRDPGRIGWKCAHAGQRENFYEPGTRSWAAVTPAECRAWCEAQFDARGAREAHDDPAAGCCAWTPVNNAGGAGRCVVSTGMALLYESIPCTRPSRETPRGSEAPGDCLMPLAYDVCRLAPGFAAAHARCVEASPTLAHVPAADVGACTRACAERPSCRAAMFTNETYFPPEGSRRRRRRRRGRSDLAGAGPEYAGGPGCLLFSSCTVQRLDEPPLPGWRFSVRVASAEEGSEAGGARPGEPGAEDDSPAARRRRRRRGEEPPPSPPGGGGTAPSTSPPGPQPFECDVSRGRTIADAMHMGGDFGPDKCTQVCLPKGFWGPASKRGVVRGYCAENGCTQFVRVGKKSGVPYNLYQCACPNTNASALYSCPTTLAALAEKADQGAD